MSLQISIQYIAGTDLFNDSPIKFDDNLEKTLAKWSDENNEIHTWVNEELEDDLLIKSQIHLKADIKNDRIFSKVIYHLNRKPSDFELEKIIDATTSQLSDGYGEEPIEITLKKGLFSKNKIYISLLGMVQSYPVLIEKITDTETVILYQKIECSKEILEAVEKGDFEFVKQYIENQGIVNCKSDNERSLLVHSIAKKQEEIAFYLIESGADISNLSNLLVHTCISGLVKLAHFLIVKGADVNYRGHNKKTPLMWGRNYLELTKLLINNKADINAQDIDGKTVLSLSSNPDVVEYLLSVGVDIELKDFFGKNALTTFKENSDFTSSNELKANYKKIIELLENH